MYKKTLLASAIVGALAVTAGPAFVGAADRSCDTSYAKKYFAECNGTDTRADPRERALDKYESHPFYEQNAQVGDGTMQPGVTAPAATVEASSGARVTFSQETFDRSLEESETIQQMQGNINNNRLSIDTLSAATENNSSNIQAISEYAQENRNQLNTNIDRINSNSAAISQNVVTLNQMGSEINLNESRIAEIDSEISGIKGNYVTSAELQTIMDGLESGTGAQIISVLEGSFSTYYDAPSPYLYTHRVQGPDGVIATQGHSYLGHLHMCDVYSIYEMSPNADGTAFEEPVFKEHITIDRGAVEARLTSGTQSYYAFVLAPTDLGTDRNRSSATNELIYKHTSFVSEAPSQYTLRGYPFNLVKFKRGTRLPSCPNQGV